jgi:hypothetical protein
MKNAIGELSLNPIRPDLWYHALTCLVSSFVYASYSLLLHRIPFLTLIVIQRYMTCHSPQSHDYAFVHPLPLPTCLLHPLHTNTKMSSTANELPPTPLGGMKRRSSSFSQRVQVKGASIKVCPSFNSHRHLANFSFLRLLARDGDELADDRQWDHG